MALTASAQYSLMWTHFSFFLFSEEYIYISFNFSFTPFLSVAAFKKKEKLAINNQVSGCLWELCCSYWVTPRASLETLSFCPGDLGWFSASDSLSCHLIEEGTRRLPLSWNWSQSHWPYCMNLSFCSLRWVISYLSIVKF